MKFFSYTEKIRAENKALAIVSIVLSLVVAGEGGALYKMYKDKTVVVLPARIEKEFWVAGDEVSGSYLEQTAYYVADRILTVSPENIDASLSAVYPFLSSEPDDIREMKTMFASLSSAVKRENYYQVFYPMKFYRTGGKLFVEGLLKKSAGQLFIGEEKKTIEIKYAVRQGRFIIKEFALK